MKLAILLILILAARADSPSRYEPTKPTTNLTTKPALSSWSHTAMFANQCRCWRCAWYWAVQEMEAEQTMQRLKREFE